MISEVDFSEGWIAKAKDRMPSRHFMAYTRTSDITFDDPGVVETLITILKVAVDLTRFEPIGRGSK